jgi:type II secretion system protein N
VNRPRALRVAAYLLYGLVLGGVLFFWKFPYKSLKQGVEISVSDHLGLRVEIADLSPAFPPGFKITRCAVRAPASEGEPLFEMSQVRLRLRILPFLQGKLGVTLRGQAYNGALDGDLLLEPFSGMRHYQLKLNLRGGRLEAFTAASRLLGRPIRGEISGELQLQESPNQPEKPTGGGTFQLKGGSCGIDSPFLKVNSLDDLEVSAAMSFADGKLEINSCAFKASGLRGSIKGTLAFRSSLPQSILELSGQCQIDSGLLNLDQATGKAVPAFLEQKRPIPFRLTGTLASPNFRLF